MSFFLHSKNYMLTSLFFISATFSYLYSHEHVQIRFHIVNEAFNNSHNGLKNITNKFLTEVWHEACSKDRCDIHLINEIAYQKLNQKIGPAKILFEHGLRLANPSAHISTSDYNLSFSSIAKFREDDLTSWSDQGHPLVIIFSNFALENKDFTNLKARYDDPCHVIGLDFSISNKSNDEKNPQEIFYLWTSKFAEEGIAGTEKEICSQGNGWRLAVIVADSVVAAPKLCVPLHEGGTITGRFTPADLAQFGLESGKDIQELDYFSEKGFRDLDFEQESLESDEYFTNLLLKIERLEIEIQGSDDPEWKTFHTELIALLKEQMLALKTSFTNTTVKDFDIQGSLLKSKELLIKWHRKFDFNFQKNLLNLAITMMTTLEMNDLKDPEFEQNVNKWVQELAKDFPEESACYALLAKLLIKNRADRREVLSMLEKGLNIDPTHKECLELKETVSKTLNR